MKAHLLPVLLLPTLALANHESITDAAGTVAPLTISLTLSESIGGKLLTEAKRDPVAYPDYTTFSTTYTQDALVSNVMNPFGWDVAKGNHYVERAGSNRDGSLVTAVGEFDIARSRYTNATLLADLVTLGEIPAATGYRIVAVRFDIHHEYHFFTTGGYNTHVNDHYYFFAEKGADDPEPVYLGAEYNEIYIHNDLVGLTRVTEVKSGKYTDVFTGAEGGYVYSLGSLGYAKTTAGEFFFYRPTPSVDSFYKITAQGLYRWKEGYDKARNAITTGAITGTGLVGPAQGYFGVADEDHPGTFHEYIPNGGNQAVVTGSIKAAAAKRYDSMLKYLNKIPAVMPH